MHRLPAFTRTSIPSRSGGPVLHRRQVQRHQRSRSRGNGRLQQLRSARRHCVGSDRNREDVSPRRRRPVLLLASARPVPERCGDFGALQPAHRPERLNHRSLADWSALGSAGGLSDFTSGFPQRYTLKNAPKNATFVTNPTVFGLQPGVKWVTPEIYDWNVTFERQLRSDTVIHASYVGTRGTHLRQDVNLNPGVYTAGSTASLQARRPYQPFGVIYQNRNTGANGYNGLQFDLEKRPASGGTGILNQITLLANYTYSHANDYGLSENGGITDIGSSIGSGMSFYDPRQHAFETGPATFDHRHHFVAFVRVESSQAHRLQWAGAQHCWWMAMDRYLLIHHRRSADHPGWNRPIPDRQQSRSRGLHRLCRPVRQVAFESILAGVLESSTACSWLDPTQFAKPAAETMEMSAKEPGAARISGMWTRASSRTSIPCRPTKDSTSSSGAEFFNLFNHPQWSDPNVTFANGAFGSTRSTIGTATGNVGTTADSRIIQLALKMNF